jgi:tRNA(His) 5'-end guanylyltransferase
MRKQHSYSYWMLRNCGYSPASAAYLSGESKDETMKYFWSGGSDEKCGGINPEKQRIHDKENNKEE